MFSRRSVLAGLGVSPLAAGCAAYTAEANAPKTFVFIPGTWHGGWVWTPLAENLIRQGHRAFPVTCTGLGERAHLVSPEVGLQTHIDDVVAVIENEELSNVTLVAHSFGGITATGVCDRLRNRIERVVFFDAFIPTRDRPAWVLRDDNGNWPDWWAKRQAKFIDGYLMDFFSEYPVEMLVDPKTHPDVAALVQRRLTPHPAKQWTDKVSFTHGGWENLPRAYIHCVGQTFRQSSAAMYGPAKEAGWDFHELAVPRLGMLSHVHETAALLLRL